MPSNHWCIIGFNLVSLVFDGNSTCVCQRLARWLGQVDVVHVRNTKCSNTKSDFCKLCNLPKSRLLHNLSTFAWTTLWPWPWSRSGRRKGRGWSSWSAWRWSRPLSLPHSHRLPTRHCIRGLVLLYPREPCWQEARTEAEAEEACSSKSSCSWSRVRKTCSCCSFYLRECIDPREAASCIGGHAGCSSPAVAIQVFETFAQSKLFQIKFGTGDWLLTSDSKPCRHILCFSSFEY